VRTAAKGGRARLVLAVLLVLLGTSAVVVPVAGGPADSAAAASASHQELHDWLRLSGASRHGMSTVVPDGWWAVYTRAPVAATLAGSATVGAVSTVAAVAATPTPRSSRAPPVVR
jgi:hypothetical protein